MRLIKQLVYTNLIIIMLIVIIPVQKQAQTLISNEIDVSENQIEEISSRGTEEFRQSSDMIITKEQEIAEEVTHISEKGIQFIKEHERMRFNREKV